MKQFVLTILFTTFAISITQAQFAGGSDSEADAYQIEKAVAQELSLSSIEGAVIIAEDGQFLGKITTNSVDPQSIGNSVGRYGGKVSTTSIFNEVGQYGGRVSRMSPFNPVSSVPPRVYKGNNFIGYLTVNQVNTPRIDPYALIGWINVN